MLLLMFVGFAMVEGKIEKGIRSARRPSKSKNEKPHGEPPGVRNGSLSLTKSRGERQSIGVVD